MNPHDQTPVFHALWAHDLQTAGQGDINWLWHGFLAPGMTTLLTSQWKAGKTTLIAALLAKLKEGGKFGDLDLRPGKAVIITEESSAHWFQRNRTLAFGDHLCWFCRPFVGRPRPRAWQALLDHVLDLHAQHHFDLAVIDPLLHFLSADSENSATGMIDFLLTLQRWTAAGLALMFSHHPRKGHVLPGQSARGSGALSGFVDILMEMTWFHRASASDRRRLFCAYSRFDQTPRSLVLELNPECTDYINHGAFEDDEFQDNWKHVQTILQDGPSKMTRKQLLENWPPDFPTPAPATLWRWLDRACDLGLARMDGRGSKTSPFRYWLPEREKDDLFRFFSQAERIGQEYDQILRDLGYLPPFQNVSAQDMAHAQHLATQRVYGNDSGSQENLSGDEAKLPEDSTTGEPPLPTPPALGLSGAQPESPPPESCSLPPALGASLSTPPPPRKPLPWPDSLMEPHQPPE